MEIMNKTKLMISFCVLFFYVISSFGQNVEMAIVMGDIEQVKSIVEKNPDVMINTIGPSKLSLLAFAASMENRDIVEYFIEKGMDVNWKSPGGYNLLHTTARFAGNPAITQFLIEKGLDVNYKIESGKKHDGITALHIAARRGHIDMATILIRNGADVNSQEPTEGNTPLHLAFSSCRNEFAELLMQNNVNMSLLNTAGVPSRLYEKLPECSDGSIFESYNPSLFGVDIDIINPTDFAVLIGLYLENKGHKTSIAAKSEKTVRIPALARDYLVYCLYTNNPDVIYQAKQLSVSLNKNKYYLTISKKPMEEYKLVDLD